MNNNDKTGLAMIIAVAIVAFMLVTGGVLG